MKRFTYIIAVMFLLSVFTISCGDSSNDGLTVLPNSPVSNEPVSVVALTGNVVIEGTSSLTASAPTITGYIVAIPANGLTRRVTIDEAGNFSITLDTGDSYMLSILGADAKFVAIIEFSDGTQLLLNESSQSEINLGQIIASLHRATPANDPVKNGITKGNPNANLDTDNDGNGIPDIAEDVTEDSIECKDGKPVDHSTPTVPQSIVANSVSSTLVELSWAPSTDDIAVVGYNIYCNNVMLDSSVATQYSDNGVIEDNNYCYTITAVDRAGKESALSAEICTSTYRWVPMSTVNAPSAKHQHTVVWTGSELISWGGIDSTYTDSGGIYDPATDTWTPMTTTGAPTARSLHTAVWTGSKLVIWGGKDSTGAQLNTGAVYDPATDTWSSTSTVGAPTARESHTAAWTGTEMLIWGGNNSTSYLGKGAIYNPETNTWRVMSGTNSPSARFGHTSVWTGTEMIIWGGAGFTNTGAMFNPTTNTWTTTSIVNAPKARSNHSAVWTGSKMIIWGGAQLQQDRYDTGGIYDPATDTWEAATSLTNAPSKRSRHNAVWTGSKMIVWGGADTTGQAVNSGGEYDPATDSWIATSTTGAPSATWGPAMVWTGSRMIVWSGILGVNGGMYLPQ